MHLADHPSGNVSDLILKLQAQRRAIAAAAAATDRILEEIAVSLLVPRPARAAAAGHAAHGAHTATGANGADGSRPKTGPRRKAAAPAGRGKAAAAGTGCAAKPALPSLGRLWADVV